MTRALARVLVIHEQAPLVGCASNVGVLGAAPGDTAVLAVR